MNVTIRKFYRAIIVHARFWNDVFRFLSRDIQVK